MITLRDVMPKEFVSGEYNNTPAMKRWLVEVVRTHSRSQDPNFEEWPGKHKNVHLWCELIDGYSVGFNENVATGWSFPVIKTVLVKPVVDPEPECDDSEWNQTMYLSDKEWDLLKEAVTSTMGRRGQPIETMRGLKGLFDRLTTEDTRKNNEQK